MLSSVTHKAREEFPSNQTEEFKKSVHIIAVFLRAPLCSGLLLLLPSLNSSISR